MTEIQAAWSHPDIPWLDALVARHASAIEARLKHGDLPRWASALAQISTLPKVTPHLGPEVGSPTLDGVEPALLEQALRGLMPWRKGPFRFGPVHIDTEWRSDLKWARIAPSLDLTGHQVLDVGSGSGYHLWRMLEAGADTALGIDPSVLFHCQFAAIKTLLNHPKAVSLPVTLESFRAGPLMFDSVFSMGVLYHRKDPIVHLEQLKSLLKPGGQLILETLVIEGDAEDVLVPPDRYARMNNVWFLPSVAALSRWLERLQFTDIRVLDVTHTTVLEQRRTDWMQFESFEQALDPNNPHQTVEGLPAPCRAAFVARMPS